MFGTNGWYPAWKPGGMALSFTSERDGQADVYMMPPTGENETRLTPQSDMLTASDWSPDGAFLAYVAGQPTGVPDLYVLDLDRDYLFRLTADAATESDPDWRSSGEPARPCVVRPVSSTISTRVGPGENRGEFTRLEVDEQYLVTGQTLDAQGNLWYELDKTQVPGHEAVNALWVRAQDVDSTGACGALPQASAPPLIPLTSPSGNPDGTWGACGSCSGCGGSTDECVQSPTGECVWDPARCASAPPPPPPQDDDDDVGDDDGGGDPPPPPPPQPTCYTINTSIQPNGTYGSVTFNPLLNCPTGPSDGWAAGSSITIQAFPSPGKRFSNWNGSSCNGVSGSSNPLTFTLTGNCTIVANFYTIIID
jgi:hypothetical protein